MLEDVEQDPKDASAEKEHPLGELKGQTGEHAIEDPNLVQTRMLGNLCDPVEEAASHGGGLKTRERKTLQTLRSRSIVCTQKGQKRGSGSS